MPSFKRKYVHAFRDRHGVQRYYFRHKGKRTALPGKPETPEFEQAYSALLADASPSTTAPRKREGQGSFGALVKQYLASPNFRDLAESTKREYRRVAEKLAGEHGHRAVAKVERPNVIKIRDALADTPGAANTVVRTMSVLLSFAVECGYRADNPARGIRLFKVGEWRAWTEEERKAFEERWPAGTMQRRAYALALYTGQRRADLVAMTKAAIEGGAIHVVQSKTGVGLWIPMHSALRAELAGVAHMSLLTTAAGKAFDPVYFGAWFAEAIGGAGLPEDCVLHGLRKSAAQALAEAGCSDAQIMAVTGHATNAMIRKYTKGADQRRMAEDAIAKMEGGNGRRT